MNNTLTLATYNIQFSQHPEKILKTLKSLVDSGAAILCLQEVYVQPDRDIVKQILNTLGKSWDALCHLGKNGDVLSMGNCILWNKEKISLISHSFMNLPESKSLAFHEKIFSLLAGGIAIPFKRRIILANFIINNNKFCIANVHLDHNGGTKNRLIQLAFIKNSLEKFSISNKEILCGDFNCFDLSKNGKEDASYKEILGQDYIEATKHIDWTGDLYDIDTTMGNILFGKLIRFLNIHVKRKIDYIWLKNIALSKCDKLNVSGSDHKPIVADLVIQ
ncbi:MAG: hypothetical protein WAU07_05595 [Microgenomates group bacterium]